MKKEGAEERDKHEEQGENLYILYNTHCWNTKTRKNQSTTNSQ